MTDMRRFRQNPIAQAILTVLLARQELPASAQDLLPQGGTAVSGSVEIGQPSGGQMTVQQSSPRAIVNWNSFSVGEGNAVKFEQPGSQAAILNRVNGSTASTIAGKVSANGQVFLVNPNGIAITPSGSVEAAGFVGSTLDIRDEDFNAGKLEFSGKGASAPVSNDGRISTPAGGFAALLGGRVANHGTVSVPLGKVGIGAGERATLDLDGDGFLQVAIPTKGTRSDAPLIEQAGTVSADGGRIEMRAATVREAVRQVVNIPGTVSATSVSGRDGAIVFDAGEGGEVKVSGRVAAEGRDGAQGGSIAISGAAATLDGSQLSVRGDGSRGGSVTVTAETVSVRDSTIDASGTSGGGKLRIGGDFQGGGTMARARKTTVDARSTLRADATVEGDGGSVVVWSDERTEFAGRVSARGAGSTGSGGDAEVSGRATLVYEGSTDLRAADDTVSGRTGNLLLDPYNVTISNGPDSGAGFTASADDTVINTTTLQNALGMANVTVSTGSSGTQAGNITVANAVTWSSGTQLTLNAANDITVNAPLSATGGGGIQLTAGNNITLASMLGVGAGGGLGVLLQANDGITANAGSSITTQGQAITLNSDRDASGAGPIYINSASITSNGGAITLGGGATPATTPAFATAAANGVQLNAATLASGGGAITIRGQGSANAALGSNGVYASGATSLSAGSGAITIVGQGGAASGSAIGVNWTAGTIGTTSGNVSITGTGGGNSAGTVNRGIDFRGSITSTSGGIALQGTAGLGTANNDGVLVRYGPISTGGDIAIQGTTTSGNANSFSNGIEIYEAAVQALGSGNLTLTARANAGNVAFETNRGTTVATTVATGTGALSILADSVFVGSSATFSGAGSLLVAPTTASTPMGLGTGASGTLNLDSTMLARFSNGFSGLTFGSATGSGAVDVRTFAFSDPLTIRSPSGTGSIALNGALSTGSGTSAGSVTLQAGDSIIGASGSSVTTQGQAITLNSDRDASGAGAISLSNTTLTSNGGAITLGGGLTPASTAAVGSGSYTSGIVTSNGSISSSGGAISLTGRALAGTANAAGVSIGGTTVQSGAGAISITGAGNGAGGSNGVSVWANAVVRSTDGDISITGTTPASTGDVQNAVEISSLVEATGAGNVGISGTATAGANNFIRGLWMGWGGVARAGTGALTVTAASGDTTNNPALSLAQNGTATLSANGGLTINANTITATSNASISGTGPLVIQPTGAAATVGLGNSASGLLNLDATELATIQNGFSSITFGSATGSGAVDVRTFAFSDPVTIRSPSGTGSITLNGALSTGSGTSAGSITLLAGGALTGAAGSSITTQNQAINLTAAPVSGAMALASNGGLVTATQTGSGTVTGAISGGGGLRLTGGGTLVLGNTNTYTGGTTVSAGTLQVGSGTGTRLGTGNVFIDTGARLLFNTTGYHGGTLLASNLSGGGLVEVAGSASNSIVRFSGDNSAFSGTFQLNTGARATLQSATAGSAAAAFVIDGLLTPQVTNAELFFGSLAGSGAISLGGGNTNTTLTIGGNGQSTTFTGKIGNVIDTIHLRKVGAGTLTLADGNTYIGTTRVEAGTLRAGASSAFGANSAVTLSAGATMDVAGYGIAVGSLAGAGGRVTNSGASAATFTVGGNGASTSFAGSLEGGTGGLALTKNGGGTLTLAGANTYPGTTTVSGGALSLTGSLDVGAGTANVNVAAGANFGGSGTLTAGTLAVSGAGTVDLGGNNVIANLSSSGTIGALRLSNTVGLNVGAITGSGAVELRTTGATADITLTGAVSSSAPGDAVVIASGRDFINNAGPGGISMTGGGRFLVYSNDWAADTVGGLSAGHLYNRSFASDPPATIGLPGSWLIHARQPSLTVTADDASRWYGDANPLLTTTINGLVNGDTAASAWTGAAGVSTLAGVTSTVGDYAITPTVGSLSSVLGYGFNFVSGTLSVTPRPLVVTADDASRMYGAANPALTYTVGGAGLVNGDVLSGALATAATPTSDVGNYGISQGTLSSSSNYSLGFTAGTLSVTPRPLVVTADDASRMYGAANPALTYTVGGAGLVNGDVLSGALATAATPTSDVGNYGIAQGTLSSSSNYSLGFTAGTLSVTPRPLYVTANDVSKTYDGLAFIGGGGVTYAGFVNGDDAGDLSGTLTYAGSSQGALIPGRYDITPLGLGATNYTMTFVDGTLLINAADGVEPPSSGVDATRPNEPSRYLDEGNLPFDSSDRGTRICWDPSMVSHSTQIHAALNQRGNCGS